MPWNGLDEKDWDKMDRCVEQVMADGKDKETAIAICMRSIKGAAEDEQGRNGKTMVVLSAEETVTFAPVTEDEYGALSAVQAGKLPARGDLLSFKGSILARRERNANGDELSEDNLRELADTLPFKPLLSSHSPQSSIVGMYTGGKVESREDGGRYLIADGILWVNRAKQAVLGILGGLYRQSIEAVSEMVECTVCGRRFNDTNYCSHLAPILQGQALPPSVGRRHYNMRAIGGALVARPAGTNAGFDTSVFMMASQLMTEVSMTEDTAMVSEPVASPPETPQETVAQEAGQQEQQMTAQIAELNAKLAEAEGRVVLTAERVLSLVQAGFGTDEVRQLLPKLPTMDNDVLEFLMSSRQRATAMAGQKPKVTTTDEPAAMMMGAPTPGQTLTWDKLFGVRK